MPVDTEKVYLLNLILVPYWSFQVIASEIDSRRPTGQRTQACHTLLESEVARDLKRIQLTPDLLGKAVGEDRVLLEAMIGIFKNCDDRLLTRLSQAVIESPVPLTKELVLANPFFRAHPDHFRPFAAVTFTALSGQFADILDEYQLGLLSSLIPDLPRVEGETTEPIESPPLMSDGENKLARARFRDIVRSDDYRAGLHKVLATAAEDLSFLIDCQNIVSRLGLRVDRRMFEPANVSATLDRFAKARLNARDEKIVAGLTSTLTMRIASWARDLEIPRVRRRISVGNDTLNVLYRDYFQRYTEQYFTDQMGMKTNLDAQVLAFVAASTTEPLPIDGKLLRLHLINGSRALVDTVARKYRVIKSSATAPTQNLSPTSIVAPSFAPKDFFAPPPTGRKRKSEKAERTSITLGPLNRDGVGRTPVEELHAFTTFSENPREIAKLKTDTIYRFRYLREPAQTVRQVRFSPAAVLWLKENPAQARSILSTLNLGYFREGMAGIKPVKAKSRRYGGTIYEVKNFGNFRPLLIMVDGTWEVLRITQKDNVERDVKWLEPL